MAFRLGGVATCRSRLMRSTRFLPRRHHGDRLHWSAVISEYDGHRVFTASSPPRQSNIVSNDTRSNLNELEQCCAKLRAGKPHTAECYRRVNPPSTPRIKA